MAKPVDPEFMTQAASKIQLPSYVQTVLVLLYVFGHMVWKLLDTSLNRVPMVASFLYLLEQAGLIACVRVPCPRSLARAQVFNTLLMCLLAIVIAFSNQDHKKRSDQLVIGSMRSDQLPSAIIGMTDGAVTRQAYLQPQCSPTL